MKLYLSSYRIPVPAALTALLGKTAAQTTIALIPNAKDYYAERARAFKLAQVQADAAALGYHAISVIDLRAYHDAAALEAALEGFDAVWVIGGNTFCLRYEAHRSGFDSAIRALLARGTVYIGESAGAVMAGTSLRGIELADEPAFAESVLWDGLGLVPQVVLPHADSVAYTELVAQANALHRASGTTPLLLNDNQALVVQGTKQHIVTAP